MGAVDMAAEAERPGQNCRVWGSRAANPSSVGLYAHEDDNAEKN